jgi:hypothetical protein
MTFTLPAGEPPVGPWRAVLVPEVVELVLRATGPVAGRPRIVAIDGRSAGGKSTVTERLEREATRMGIRTAVVHTDDVAWYESFFEWAPLMIEGVLAPLRRGGDVHYRPPAWEERGRSGAIDVPASVELVLVEGVGASQRDLAQFVDASVWVQSDLDEAERRGIARDVASGVNGDEEQSRAFWAEWMSQELPFLAEDRPWERATLVVAGTPSIPLQSDEVAISP